MTVGGNLQLIKPAFFPEDEQLEQANGKHHDEGVNVAMSRVKLGHIIGYNVPVYILPAKVHAVDPGNKG